MSANSFPTQFQNPLPTAHDNIHTRVSKLELRTLEIEAVGGTVPNFEALGDARYVRKSGDIMTGSLGILNNFSVLGETSLTGNLAVSGTSEFSGELTIQTNSPTETVLSVVNNLSPSGAGGSGGAAVLSLVSKTAAQYEWRIVAEGAADRLLFQDGGVNTRAWIAPSAAGTFGSFFAIGAPLFGILPVLLHNSGAGRLLLTNLAQTDFDRLQFGGITAAFPALKRAATVLEVVLADDSARAQLYGATLRTNQTTVALLPAAATAGVGATAFVTDANATKAAGDGTVVVGGGANAVPVYSTGSAWLIG